MGPLPLVTGSEWSPGTNPGLIKEGGCRDFVELVAKLLSGLKSGQLS